MHIDLHPLLAVRAFTTDFAQPLGALETPPNILALLSPAATAPLERTDAVREAVRVMLRHGGFKPAGRSKPASEYLVRAAAEGTLASINLAVDACNAVSLHSGLPISVVDLAKAKPPIRIAIADAGASYIFNASGQTIDLEGLLCLFDADGPCANAVKDAQRTKTDVNTTQTLTVIWGASALGDWTARTETWYRQLLHDANAVTAPA